MTWGGRGEFLSDAPSVWHMVSHWSWVCDFLNWTEQWAPSHKMPPYMSEHPPTYKSLSTPASSWNLPNVGHLSTDTWAHGFMAPPDVPTNNTNGALCKQQIKTDYKCPSLHLTQILPGALFIWHMNTWVYGFPSCANTELNWHRPGQLAFRISYTWAAPTADRPGVFAISSSGS